MKKLLLSFFTIVLLVSCNPKFDENHSKEDLPKEDVTPEIIYEYQDVYIVTHIDSGINSIGDLKDKKIAIQMYYDSENSEYVKDELIKKHGLTEDNFVLSDMYSHAAFSLWYNGYNDVHIDNLLPIDAIVVSKEVHETLEEYVPYYIEDDYIKILSTFERPYLEEPEPDFNQDLLAKPFAVLITGIDERVDPDGHGRNDVNMVMAVNPEKKRITIVGYPRDSYMVNTCTTYKDKLTHFGGKGKIDCVKDSLAKNLDIDIDYHAQVSFSSFIDLIDQIGGLKVDVPLNMCLNQDSNRIIGVNICLEKGENMLWGEEVLAFARNRKSGVYGGDFGRIRNQQLIINSLIKKFQSYPLVTFISTLNRNYDDLVYHNFEVRDIISLIKLTFDMNEEYEIDNYFIQTTHGRDTNDLYIGIIGDESLEVAKLKMKITLGEVISTDNPLYKKVIKGYYTRGAGNYTDKYLGDVFTIEN